MALAAVAHRLGGLRFLEARPKAAAHRPARIAYAAGVDLRPELSRAAFVIAGTIAAVIQSAQDYVLLSLANPVAFYSLHTPGLSP